MFGCTPGIFESKMAAELAAKSYSIEEGVKWKIAKKHTDGNKCYFKPYRIEDINCVKKDGWKPIVKF